jgi:arylsulfatase A-like enzyme
MRTALAILSLAALFFPQAQRAPSDRLNVLFLVADDLNNDLGVYGGPARRRTSIVWPRAGRFDRAYAQYRSAIPAGPRS